MICVLPVCHKDVALAQRNLDYLLTLEGRSEFSCLLSYETGFEADVAPLQELCARYFVTVDTFRYDPWKGDASWPQPQNWAFQHTARWIEAQRKWPAFFWWESDATPLRAGAISNLANAYITGAQPFAGPITTHLGMHYMAGVAVYPSNVSRYMPSALICRSQAWDIVASVRDGLLRHVHDLSNLIIHDPAPGGNTFDSRADVDRVTTESSIFYHKCKDGSLLDVLQGKERNDEGARLASVSPVIQTRVSIPSFTEQTKWESGYFTFPASPNTVHFNCSICESNGQLHLFTRRYRFNLEQTTGGAKQGSQSDLAIWNIRDNLSLHPKPLIPAIPLRYPHEQWEDPRVVIGEDTRAYVSFATWVHWKQWGIRQSFARLSRDWRAVEPLWETPYGGNSRKPEPARQHEKNWIWFQHEGQWHCQYAINPGEFFRVDDKGNPVQVWKSKEVRLPWEDGLPLRGGTPPTRIGEEYLAFFHSAVPWQKPKRRYHMGAYTFSAYPPFEIKRITSKPLLTGSEDDFREFHGPLVIFPNGAVFRDSTWLVVFGVNDEACGWIKIPHADLDAQLVDVKRSLGERLLKAFA